jgi:hypothetical protein
MRVEDEDEDATFVWIEMNRDYGEYETAKTLRKIAASRDCSNEGGVLFEDFEWSHGLAIPKTRLLVSGLKEKVTHQITTVEFEWNETVDDSIFDKLPKEKVAAEPDAEESDSDEASEEKKQ